MEKGKRELLPNTESTKPWLSKARLQTHIEVLWRTLIADTWEGQHPAPIEAGRAFADALIAQIQHLCLKIQVAAMEAKSQQSSVVESTPRESSGDDESVLKQLFEVFVILADSELEGFIRAKGIVEDGTFETISSADPLVASLPKEKASEMLTQFLPIFENFSDVLKYKIDMNRIKLWSRRFSQFMPGRKLFRTGPYQFLGSGPKSLEIGDVVCILAGGNVPYLLRKVDGPDEDRYTFIGEAYVHGMMHGEAAYIMAEEEVEEWTIVTLV